MNKTQSFDIPLAGFRATLSSTEWVLEIRFSNAEHKQYILQIEGAFTLITPSGDSLDLRPDQKSVSSPALAESVAMGATGITIHEDGSLDAQFANKASMSISSSEDFEAWNITGPSEFRVVSLPGGGLSGWAFENRPK